MSIHKNKKHIFWEHKVRKVGPKKNTLRFDRVDFVITLESRSVEPRITQSYLFSWFLNVENTYCMALDNWDIY